MRILLIDDDRELCLLLRELLDREGFAVQAVHDGLAGLREALSGSADLVVLDLMLPGIDGLNVLRRLRRESRIPVLCLTARGDEQARIDGLEGGADDYLPKPFNPRELVARLRAILRRVRQTGESTAPLEAGGVRLDSATREVMVEGTLIPVTTFEFDILEALLAAAGRVVSRDELAGVVYHRRAAMYERSIDMHVSHLRRKLPAGTQRIKTIRGTGYQFCEPGGDAR